MFWKYETVIRMFIKLIIFLLFFARIVSSKLNNDVLFINSQNEYDYNCALDEHGTNNIFLIKSNRTFLLDINNKSYC